MVLPKPPDRRHAMHGPFIRRVDKNEMPLVTAIPNDSSRAPSSRWVEELAE